MEYEKKECSKNSHHILIKDEKGKNNEVVLRIAKQSDAENIHAIMRSVYDGLEDKSIYVCDDLEYVQTHIEKNGLGVVACNSSDEIVASFLLRFPDNSDDNLGRDIGLSEEELTRVVHMETAVVIPKYRGRHLQLLMLDYAERIIDRSKYDILLATVSPDNPASYKTFERNGYKRMLTKEKYGGLQRHIYMKTLHK